MKKPRAAATKIRPVEAAPGDVEAIVAGVHGDPFAILGVQESADGFVARCFVPHAEAATAHTLDGRGVGVLACRTFAFEQYSALGGERCHRQCSQGEEAHEGL